MEPSSLRFEDSPHVRRHRPLYLGFDQWRNLVGLVPRGRGMWGVMVWDNPMEEMWDSLVPLPTFEEALTEWEGLVVVYYGEVVVP